MTDHNGKLRIAITSDGVKTSILHRDSENEKFKPILTTELKVNVSPLFFTFSNKNLYVSSNRNRDKAGIFEFDINKGEERKLLFEHNEINVSGLMYSRKRKVLTGVNYTVAKRKIVFFDSWRGDIQNKLEKFLNKNIGKRL